MNVRRFKVGAAHGALMKCLLAAAWIAPTPPTAAQEVKTLADLQAQGAVELERSELLELMRGARVVTYNRNHLDRAWTNNEDGAFVASMRRTSLPSTSGHGTWLIPEGALAHYCVRIQWQTGVASREEKWCARVFRLGDRYFGVNAFSWPGDLTVPARVMEIRKPIRQERQEG